MGKKLLKNNERTACGIKFNLFTIVKVSGVYMYYTNAIWTKNKGDALIWKSSRKSKLLNKFTLSIIGVFYTFFTYVLKYPILAILFPLYVYFDGCRNFVLNKAKHTNVRLFNWVNIVLIVLLLLLIF